MELNLVGPEQAPLPPEDVRFRGVEVAPYSDGRRVKVDLDVTPFLKRPNIDIRVMNETGDEVASAHIVETMTPSLSLTVHLRGPEPEGEHTLALKLFYSDEEGAELVVDRHELSFDAQGRPDMSPG